MQNVAFGQVLAEHLARQTLGASLFLRDYRCAVFERRLQLGAPARRSHSADVLSLSLI